MNAQTYRARDTPLHLAIKGLKPTMVNFLLKNGANPEIPNAENLTCVDLADELRKVRDWDKRKHLIVRFIRFIRENDFVEEYGDLGEDELLQRPGTIPTTRRSGTSAAAAGRAR